MIWRSPDISPNEVNLLHQILDGSYPTSSIADSIALGREWNQIVRSRKYENSVYKDRRNSATDAKKESLLTSALG